MSIETIAYRETCDALNGKPSIHDYHRVDGQLDGQRADHVPPCAVRLSEAYQALNSQYLNYQNSASRLGTLLREIFDQRDLWLQRFRGESWQKDPAGIQFLYGRLATCLGPVINDATDKHREVKKAADDTWQRLLDMESEYHDERDKSDDLVPKVDAMREAIVEKQYRANDDGCCGEQPDSSGYCYGIRTVCPLVAQIKSCQNFVANYIEWIERINEEPASAV